VVNSVVSAEAATPNGADICESVTTASTVLVTNADAAATWTSQVKLFHR